MASLYLYTDRPLDLFPVDITNKTVREVAGRLSEGAGTGGGELSQPSALDTDFQNRKWEPASDCRGLRGVVEQWAAPMGCLLLHDEQPSDFIVKSSRGETGRGRGNLTAVDGRVLASGDGAGVQGYLWNIKDIRRRGDRDIGRDTRHEIAVATTHLGRGLGVTPH